MIAYAPSTLLLLAKALAQEIYTFKFWIFKNKIWLLGDLIVQLAHPLVE
jgi:hypothetical protein